MKIALTYKITDHWILDIYLNNEQRLDAVAGGQHASGARQYPRSRMFLGVFPDSKEV
jgi:hypothetical protein